MNELQIFNNEEFGSVRTAEINGKTYFVGKDVASALGYSNPRDAISRHCKGVVKHDSFKEGGQEIALIPEGDIYRLVIRSQLPDAERFESWIFDEVVPSIRKHGGYITGQETMSDEELLEKAILVAQRKIAERDALIAEQRKKLEEQKPLVDFAVHVSQAKDTIDMDEMAKIARDEHINIGRNRLIKWLKEKKILKDNRTPYQSYIERGYFDVVEVKKDTIYGTRVFPKTVVTGKGQIWIIEKLRAEYEVDVLCG